MYIHSHVFLGHKFFKTITLVAITCTRVAVAVVVATRSGISNVIIII